MEENKTKDVREIFSNNLNYIFAKFNVEQVTLAKKLQVTPAAITEWVKKRKFPRIDKLQMLAELFDLKISDLIDFELSATRQKDNHFFSTLTFHYGKNATQLLHYYQNLNDLGQEKIIETIKDLTEIPKYTEKEKKESAQNTVI